MRKIFVALIILNLITCFAVSASENTESYACDDAISSIAPYLFDGDSREITRGDGISAIMRLIGVDEKTAGEYARACYDQPVFFDQGVSDADGYIIIAKYADVALGVDDYLNGTNNFAPNRNITVKECLAFMLRCLKDTESLSWDNTIEDSVKFGLLKNEESEIYAPDSALTYEQFYTFLSRLLNMDRYLYWPDESEKPTAGHARSVKVDSAGQVKYIDSFNRKR